MVSGFGGKWELIDLSNPSLSCPVIADSPLLHGYVGMFINNKALICGGLDATDMTKDCYEYNMQVTSEVEVHMPWQL